MRVEVNDNKHLAEYDLPPELALYPETTEDGVMLERLMKYRCLGFGRHPDNGALLHVRIPLAKHEGTG